MVWGQMRHLLQLSVPRNWSIWLVFLLLCSSRTIAEGMLLSFLAENELATLSKIVNPASVVILPSRRLTSSSFNWELLSFERLRPDCMFPSIASPDLQVPNIVCVSFLGWKKAGVLRVRDLQLFTCQVSSTFQDWRCAQQYSRSSMYLYYSSR